MVLVTRGFPEASAQLRLIGEAGKAADGYRVLVAPNVPYGGYVEYGTSRMAGRFYMRRAHDQVIPLMRPRIAQAIRTGAAPVRAVFTDMGRRIEERARALAPVRTGALRASIRSVLAGGYRGR